MACSARLRAKTLSEAYGKRACRARRAQVDRVWMIFLSDLVA